MRETTNAFGKKFLEVMKLKYGAHDYAAVASDFKIKVPSVYDWVNHGRFAKARYAQLVEWSGRSLDWWFDIAPPPGAVRFVAETAASYAALPAGLTSAQRDVLGAFGDLPEERRKAVREEIMREASLYQSAFRRAPDRLPHRRRLSAAPLHHALRRQGRP